MTSQSCTAEKNADAQFLQFRQWAQSTVRIAQKSWWLTLLLWLAAILPARAELELRVAIEQDVSQVKVGSSTSAVLRDGAGRVLAEVPAMNAVMAEAKNGNIAVSQLQTSQLWIEPSGGGYVFIGDKWYRGRTLVLPTGGGLTAVNYVDLEQYLYSVVGSEMPANWPLEALKAQAVTARSYALYQRQGSANTVFDLGDTAAWQVYHGLESETPSTRAAVDSTKAQVLTYEGQIIDAVFHSSSGGHTENVEDVWTNPLPYLRGVQDFDQGTPNFQWIETVTADRMKQIISGVGNIVSITTESTTPNGRVVKVRVVGDAGTREMSGDDLRDALGLKSTLFAIVPQMGRVATTGNVTSTPNAFQINGRGFGHGLGMSQWGAYNLALQGWSYQQIVSHYYTGTALARIQVR